MGEITITFIQKIANMAVYFLCLVFLLKIIESAEMKQDVAMADQVTKSATILTVEAYEGKRSLNSQQVLCDILSLPKEIAVQVNSNTISPEVRELACSGKVTIHLPERDYEAHYTYDEYGNVVKVLYK